MKSIILLLISLFVFCIKLDNNQTVSKKQNGTITSISNNHEVIITPILDFPVLSNHFEYTFNSYSTDYINDVSSNHFEKSFNNNLTTDFIQPVVITISNKLNIVQRVYTAKTIGLRYDSNHKYFNIYLYHSVNKLGFT